MSSKKGVTIIELMMVILVLGILTLLSAPLLANLGKSTKLAHSAKNIAAYLRLARTLAVSKSMTHTVLVYSRSASETHMQNHIVITDSSGAIVEKPWSAPSGTDIPDISGNDDYVSIAFTPRGTTGSSRSIHTILKGTRISGNPYSPSGAYGSTATSFYGERYKCHTITVTGSGRARNYPYGKNTPWASQEI